MGKPYKILWDAELQLENYKDKGIPDWFRWRNSWKPTHIGGRLNTIGELIDKILEVYPITDGRPTTVNDIYGRIVSL